MQVYNSGKTIVIDQIKAEAVHIRVYDRYGEEVLQTTVRGRAPVSFTLNQQPGHYLVRVADRVQIFSQELSIP